MLMTKVDKRSARKKRAPKKDKRPEATIQLHNQSGLTGPHQRNQGKFRGRRKATQQL